MNRRYVEVQQGQSRLTICLTREFNSSASAKRVRMFDVVDSLLAIGIRCKVVSHTVADFISPVHDRQIITIR